MGGDLPANGVELSYAEIAALDARWSSCWSPAEISARLVGVAPWCVAGGWAIDLFRGGRTREHGDLEIAVPAARFGVIRARFAEYAVDAVGDRRIWEDATPEALAATHQSWLRDRATGNYLVDVFREPHDGDLWICRRDESVRLPYSEIVGHTEDGIPYLVPELVLLFKAKHARPKDVADFETAVPLMTPAQRARLAALIARVHPGHAWLRRLPAI